VPGIRDFRDKVVVITGAGSGIGRATALAFARHGANLVIADVRGDRLAEAAGEVARLGARVETREVDVSDRAQVEGLARFVMERHSRADILHNNAGVSITGSFEHTSLENWEWITGVNYWGTVYGIHYFLPHMIERRCGHIVNTASFMGICATPATTAYCATKFAVVGLSEALRAEVRRYNIGVTAICPGVINTRIVADGRSHLPQDARASLASVLDFYRKRGWPPERVANAVLKAVRKDRGIVPVGPEAWAFWGLKRLSPWAYETAARLSERLLLH